MNYKFFIFIIFFSLYFNTKEVNIEDDYYFQLCPSFNKKTPYLFHAFTPNYELLNINSSIGEDCSYKKEKVNESSYNNLSKVNVYNNSLLIKTCFGPNKIVEIINEKNETFLYENNYLENGLPSLGNIKYCYSTAFYNKKNTSEVIIATYWVSETANEYVHKIKLFYPEKKQFYEYDFILHSNAFLLHKGEKKYMHELIYPQSCVTFRNTDIYCTISSEFSKYNSFGNSYVIELDKLVLDTNSENPNFFLVYDSNKYNITGSFIKPIFVGINVYNLYDIFMTEYHNEKRNQTLLFTSLYNIQGHKSIVSLYEKNSSFHGIQIEDSYLNPNLFNNLIPNNNELIILYLMKTKSNKMALLMSRYNNILNSIKLNLNIQNISLNNYIRDDICLEPKYMQSSFINNSFINYSNKDKEIMENNKNINYYVYQRDILSLISCSNNDNSNNKVKYEPKKIIMPQCLNILDEINGIDKYNYHTLQFENGKRYMLLDIYNNPNLLSLRNISLEFLSSNLFGQIINITLIDEENKEYKFLNYLQSINTNKYIKIKFEVLNNINEKKKLFIKYRITKNGQISKTTAFCHLVSDTCKFEFKVNGTCKIPFCLQCETDNLCLKCDSSIEGIIKDEKTKKCVCDKTKNFTSSPNEKYEMCICEEGYSFYKNKSLCLSNKDLNEGPYYIIGKDNISSINIYDDCSERCQKCTDIFKCSKCKEPFILYNESCILISEFPTIPITPFPNTDQISSAPQTDIPTTEISQGNDTCLNENKIWFEMGEYKFYFAKINTCVYIFFDNSLFFCSNKKDCLNNNNYYYISKCLGNESLKNKEVYINYINTSLEYNPLDKEITIIKKIGNNTFHLVNSQTNEKFSDLKLQTTCEDKIKKKYNINKNLLIFKVDIKKSTTISTQVEYQFYNPDPQKINEQLDLSICLKDDSKRRLNEKDSSKIINLSLPVSFSDYQKKNIDDLYIKKNINIFNISDKFFNDVCNKYTSENGTDIYLKKRKEKFFINEALCEEKCTIQEYTVETGKINCMCPIKDNPNNFKDVIFYKENIDDNINKNVSAQNLLIMKCPNIVFKKENIKKNLGFYFSFILLIIFILSYIHRNTFGKTKYSDFFDEIKDYAQEEEEDENLKPEEEEDNETKPSAHLYIPPENEKEKEEENIDNESNNNNEDDNNNNNNSQSYNSSKISQKEVKNTIETEKISSSNSRSRMNNEGNESLIKASVINLKSNNNKKEKEEENLVDSKSNDNQNDSNIFVNSNINIDQEREKKDEEEKNNKSQSTLIKNNSKISNNSNMLKNNEEEKYKYFKIDGSEDDKIGKKSENPTVNVNMYDKDDNNASSLKGSEGFIKGSISSIDKEYSINNESNLIKEENKEIKEEVENLENIENILIDNTNNDIDDDKDMDYNKEMNKKNNEKDSNKKTNNFTSPSDKKSKKKKIRSSKKANPPKNKSKVKDKNENLNNSNSKNNESKSKDASYFGNKDGKDIKSNDIKLEIDENKIETSAIREMMKKKNNKDNDLNNNNNNNNNYFNYLLDKIEYTQSLKEDKRTFFQMFLSMIVNNYTIIFTFGCDKNDLFIKASVIILYLSFYLFINILLMLNSSSLHLYVRKDKDTFVFSSFLINIFIPALLYIPISIIKRLISIKEFRIDKIYEYYCVKIDKNLNKKQKKLKIHDIDTIVKKFREIYKERSFMLFIIGSVFLIFNWYLMTCFCGIYVNSFGCLLSNTLISFIFAMVIYTIIFLISSFCRKNSLSQKKEYQFTIAKYLNPTYILYNEKLYNEENDTNRKEKNEKSNLKEKEI